ncbi:MAG: hypothetical protein ABSD47_14005 [Candidatus Methylomirabilota bacterium]
MLTLRRTMIHLDPADVKRVKRLAARISKAENRRVTFSELVRRAIREFLAKQEG